MYRLSRFFVSDVIAGQNIIKNGYFPICKEGNRADHGVLFATNGSCKTTLLSFLLSVFNPEKNRFVQHLQSGGDKTLEQYLIPGRPAVVAIELITTLEPTLFEAEPLERIIVGQLLIRDTHDPGKVERLFFKSDNPDFFDSLKASWAELVDGEEPRKMVRDFIAPHVESTHLQSEWRETLTLMHLDPWLMDRQVDFARTEGGIKDAFKFKAEEEFMSFFLGCVTDMTEAETLRGTVLQNMEKMASRPEKKAQLKTIWSLKDRISNFDALGEQWRKAKEQVSTHHRHLGEAHHLLLRAARVNDTRLSDVKAQKKGTKGEITDISKSQERIKATTLQVEAKALNDEVQTFQARIEENATLLEKGKAEHAAIKAAGFMAEKRKIEAEIEDGEAVLSAKGKELVPIREQIEVRALQYHVRLAQDRTTCSERLKKQEEEKQVLLGEQQRSRKEIVLLREQIQEIQEEITRHHTMIRTGEEALSALPLEQDEIPQKAQERLKGTLDEMATQKAQLEQEIASFKEKISAKGEALERLQRLVIEAEMACKTARKEVETEESARKALHTDGILTMLSGSDSFEPTDKTLATSLQEALSRQQHKAHQITMRLMGLEAERDRLESMGTMAVDEETRKLHEHYLSQGLTRSELKLFPEYLSSRYEDTATIASFLTRDPGRFSGIMAASDKVIERVKKLEVPGWLCKPVIISTPCELDDVQPIDHHIIAPTDASVYSEDHLKRRLEELKKEVQELMAQGDEANRRLREIQNADRALGDYKRNWPDVSAVTALSDKLESEEKEKESLEAQVSQEKGQREELKTQLLDVEASLSEVHHAMAETSRKLDRVRGWLDQYGAMESWRALAEEKERQRLSMTREETALEEELKQVEDDAQALVETIAETRSLLKSLDEKGSHIPKGEKTLLEEQHKEALSHPLETLETLYRDACTRENEMAGKLGIATLTETLHRLRNELGEKRAKIDRCKEESPFDVVEALKWSQKSAADRDSRSSELLASVEDARENKGKFSAKLQEAQRKFQSHEKALRDLAVQGILPTLTEEELAAREPEDLLQELAIEAGQLKESLARLKEKLPKLDRLEKALDEWARDLAVGTAQVKHHDPLWDEISPRLGWPDIETMEEEPLPTHAFLTMVDESLAATKAADAEVNRHRQQMGSAFDRLQTELRDDELRKRLPTIVDELRRHDAETLGNQSGDFIEKCHHLAKNIEGDLARSEQFVKSLIDMLLGHARECHQKIQEAAGKKVPDNVFIYGGQPILKCGSRLEFTRHEEAFRASLDNWLHDLIEQGRMPAVNQKAGNTLGSELLYRLLRAATGKTAFGIRLLKCDDSGRHYEQVGKDLGSGGEALTTAVLLYTLLTFMRQKRRKKEDRIPAFLIADNPLGVCNRSDFLDAQLKVARAMGIQCVYFTGINDRESLGLFDHRVAIRKSERRLRIDKADYTVLEVVEQHVETRDQAHG